MDLYLNVNIRPFRELVMRLDRATKYIECSSECYEFSERLLKLVERHDESNFMIVGQVCYPGYELEQVLFEIEREAENIKQIVDDDELFDDDEEGGYLV